MAELRQPLLRPATSVGDLTRKRMAQTAVEQELDAEYRKIREVQCAMNGGCVQLSAMIEVCGNCFRSLRGGK